jgi:hypothetical protein
MKMKNLLIISSVLLGTIYSFYRLSSNYLVFEDIKDDQIVQGTDYTYGLQEVEVILPSGRPSKITEIYLINQRTHNRLSVPVRFNFDRFSEETGCHQCISVIHSHGHMYLITRAHSGGSSNYYTHSIFEVVDNRLIDRGRYSSCGNVYLRNNRVTFPTHKTDCPEPFPFTDMTWYGWEHKSFDLSEH